MADNPQYPPGSPVAGGAANPTNPFGTWPGSSPTSPALGNPAPAPPEETPAQRRAREAAEAKARAKAEADARAAAAAAAKAQAALDARSKTELANLRKNPDDQFALGWLLANPDTSGGRELAAARSGLSQLTSATQPEQSFSSGGISALPLIPQTEPEPEDPGLFDWFATKPFTNRHANYALWSGAVFLVLWLAKRRW